MEKVCKVSAFLAFCFVFVICVGATQAEQVYSHPSGIQFRYPDGWTTKESPFADFELVPPDVGTNPHGVVETYFQWEFLFESSEEKIIQNLEVLLPRVVPFLKRTGEVEHFAVSDTQGMMLSWNGKSEAGQDVWSRVFVIPRKEMTIALVAMGEKERIDQRETTIRSILSSYQFGPGEREKSLFGQWASTVQEPCINGDITGTSEIRSDLHLDPSGSFQMMESARFTGCGEDSDEGKADYDDSFDGIWFAKNGKLCLVSSSNMSMTFSFELQGSPGSRDLALKHGTGRSQVLNESRGGAQTRPRPNE